MSHFQLVIRHDQGSDLLVVVRSVAITDDGDIYCWGSNLRGQCGPASALMSQPGSITPNYAPALLDRRLFGGLQATAVSAGQFHTLIQTSDGRVWGFGRNLLGNLGPVQATGSGPIMSVPVCLSCMLPANFSVTDFAGGSDHTVFLARDVLRDGPVVMFSLGSNKFGQIAAHVNITATTTPLQAPSSLAGCAADSGTIRKDACATVYMELLEVHAGCDQTFVATKRPVCPAGSSGKDQGYVPCSPCRDGQYSVSDGSPTCVSCQIGYQGRGEGSRGCRQCPPGPLALDCMLHGFGHFFCVASHVPKCCPSSSGACLFQRALQAAWM
jgi:alpha-tubulin suppressor-like RCC1 family protein